MTATLTTSEKATMANVISFRDAQAKRIKDLAQRWGENTVALGRELKKARDTFPAAADGNRPGWDQWVRTSFGWSSKHSSTFIRISEKFPAAVGGTGLSLKVLDFLAREQTPDAGVKEVITRAKRGETIGLDKAKEIVKPYREYPKPKEANEKAKETGKAILASDGNYYFGTSKEDAEAYERKKKIVYGVRDAVETLANVGMKPGAFLRYADKHQLWRIDEEHLLTDARDWLEELLTEWESR